MNDLLVLLAAWRTCTQTQAAPQSVSDGLSMYSDPFLQAKCIEKLCEAGSIAPSECP